MSVVIDCNSIADIYIQCCQTPPAFQIFNEARVYCGAFCIAVPFAPHYIRKVFVRNQTMSVYFMHSIGNKQ